MPDRYALALDECPLHGRRCISIDNETKGFGQRVTQGKCCGRWERKHAWVLTEREWRDLGEQALAIADEMEGAG